MRGILRKLHNMSNPSEDTEWSTASRGSKPSTDGSLPDNNKILYSLSHHDSEHKSNSGLSGWLNSVSQKYNSLSTPSSPSTMAREDGEGTSDSVSSGGLDLVSSSTNSRDPDVEEEYQIKLALEMSAKEDPEAVQIEAVKQISLGSCCPPENTPAEVVAFRYWTYNALVYDDKILNGFYDVYEIMSESISEKMPSLVDLQRTQLSESVIWEAILVDRAVDANLLTLEQEALVMASNSTSDFQVFRSVNLVRKLAIFVANCMGGPVKDPNNIAIAWRSLSYSLKSTLGSLVFPIGSLTIGLSRHRALLFKVLTDTLGIPCCLVKGQEHTGFDGMAMNFVKLDDGREYIVDLMADPGTFIPSDAYGLQKGLLFSATPSIKDGHYTHVSSSISNRFSSSFEEPPKVSTVDNVLSDSNSNSFRPSISGKESKANSYFFRNFSNAEKSAVDELVPITRPIQSLSHARSPSWIEGVSSPTVQKMNVKDVSQYMIDAAKLNPQLAQKLDDVLQESGVVAPPNLFTEIYSEQSPNDGIKRTQIEIVKNDNCLLPLPRNVRSKQVVKCLDGLEIEMKAKKVPVAAAAAAAVVASSMVVAVANSRTDLNLKIPVSAAATATAAAMAATTAAINKYGEVNKSSVTPFYNQMGLHVVESGVREDNDDVVVNPETKSDGVLDAVAECEVSWDDITFGERIGLGSYGEIYRGELHGTDVAVKKLLTQDICGESLEEFKSEVRLMRRLRHPNVVLFMGAITHAPNLSIVTEFLPRGSLYRLIHRPNNQLDERRRLRMALDTARGMNYLHNCTPMIVHRDLKSPNLLVDKNWIVKVCDFGLSRMKYSTFLSSRSTAGTAEWMAPEVLRNEPSNEKCDVYSFGVVLWELCTLQQPWKGMNPMQVVGAVGFQHRRLDIPDGMDPDIASIIQSCWHRDPKLRPSFSEIMASLKPLQKPIPANSFLLRPRSPTKMHKP